MSLSKTWRWILGIPVVIVVGLAITLVVAAFSQREPPAEWLACDCELLVDWTVSLPILPSGETFEPSDVSILQSQEEFEILAGQPSLVVDHKEALIEAATQAGLGVEVRSDTEERWEIVIYPGPPSDRPNLSDAEWRASITAVNGLGLGVHVIVDGSDWGFETLQELYSLEDDEIDRIERERQEAAIRILEPFRQAMLPLGEDA